MFDVKFKIEDLAAFKLEIRKGVDGIWGYTGSNARKFYELLEPLLWVNEENFTGYIMVRIDDLRTYKRALEDAEMSIFVSKYCRPGASITKKDRDRAMFKDLVGSKVLMGMISTMDKVIEESDNAKSDDIFYQVVWKSNGFTTPGPYFKSKVLAEKLKDQVHKKGKHPHVFEPFTAWVEERKFSDNNG